MDLPTKIRNYLDRMGWSERQLAARVRVSPTTVGNWLAGRRSPRRQDFEALSRVLGVPVGYLMDDAMDEPPAPVLSDGERYLIDVLRDLGLDAREVARALLRGERLAPPEPPRSSGPVVARPLGGVADVPHVPPPKKPKKTNNNNHSAQEPDGVDKP